jgi:ribosomal protein S18 acetylase RimI-like enzyme
MKKTARPGPRESAALADDGEVSVRRLREADLRRVVEIDALHTGVKKLQYWKRRLADFLSPSDGFRLALAADRAGELAGYLLGEVRAFEFGSEPCGWILVIAVDPGVLRSGVGQALLDEACRRFGEGGVTRIRTMVRRNDVPVLAFFRSNGFAGGAYAQLEREA